MTDISKLPGAIQSLPLKQIKSVHKKKLNDKKHNNKNENNHFTDEDDDDESTGHIDEYA